MLGRLWSLVVLAIGQLIPVPAVPNTVDTLLPTERIDAMAATAINETISVYSTAVAPRLFFIKRRKNDSIDLTLIKGDPALLRGRYGKKRTRH